MACLIALRHTKGWNGPSVLFFSFIANSVEKSANSINLLIDMTGV